MSCLEMRIVQFAVEEATARTDAPHPPQDGDGLRGNGIRQFSCKL